MTKQTAIRLHCLACAGDSFKEVTLCAVLDCPLWPWRTGTSMESRSYTERVTKAMETNPEEVAELVKLGVDVSRFLPRAAKQTQRAGRAEKNLDRVDTV